MAKLDYKKQAAIGGQIRAALNELAPELGVDMDQEDVFAATVWACCQMANDAYGVSGIEQLRTVVDEVEQRVIFEQGKGGAA